MENADARTRQLDAVDTLLASLERGAVGRTAAGSTGGGKAAASGAASSSPLGAARVAVVGERGRVTLVDAGGPVVSAPTVQHGLHTDAPTPAADLEQEFFDCMRLETNDLVRLQQWWPRAFSHTLYKLPVADAHHTVQRQQPALTPALFRATEPEPVGTVPFPGGKAKSAAAGATAAVVDDTPVPVTEGWLPEALQGTASNSSSVLRAPTSTSGDNAVEKRLRGSTDNQPFRAGGLDPNSYLGGYGDADGDGDSGRRQAEADEARCDRTLFATAGATADLLQVAPGLARGLSASHVVSALGEGLATPVDATHVDAAVVHAGLARGPTDGAAATHAVVDAALAAPVCHGTPAQASQAAVTSQPDGSVDVAPADTVDGAGTRSATPPPPPNEAGTASTGAGAGAGAGAGVDADADAVSAYSTGHNPSGLLAAFKPLVEDREAIAEAKRRIVRHQQEADRDALVAAREANEAARAGRDTNAALPDAEEEAKRAMGGGLLLGGDMEELWLASDSDSDSDDSTDGDRKAASNTAGAGAGSGAGAGAGAGARDPGLPAIALGGSGDGGDDAGVDDGDDDGFGATMRELLAATTAQQQQHASGGAGARRHGAGSGGAPQESWARTDLVSDEELARHEANTVPPCTFDFTLDNFQRQAVYHLEHNDFVFVAAHTSAGKTVVAEYAMALAANHMTRCVYTSPIKALSNQKFRDFRQRFGDVGLITGDVSINPDAACLIMTTEILRSMLYRGADLIRDIEWVIFDEVHYVNDSDRGVVWEEVIIMLPEHVSMVFLSATTPNTVEFSEWIGRTKQRPVYVISTLKRPVPLKHHVYLEGELYTLLDANGNFMLRQYQEAAKVFKAKCDKKANSRGNPGGRNNAARYGYAQRADKAQWNRLCRVLKDRELLPVVVFAFSKKLCEQCAYALTGTDFTDGAEKSRTHVFIKESVKRLQGSDRQLPQVLQLTGLLLRGIGVHHGGLLPIMKEVVEILFSRGLVKVLFATETFAMGVNMPARTVIFNGVRKHDGRSFRDLMPGEYIQMSGRAGRRGLDKEGIVICTAWAGMPDGGTLHTMLTGEATKLASQFRLTYTMLLNLLRVEDMSVTDMMRRSFSEFRTQRALGGRDLPGVLRRAERRLKKLDAQAAAQDCEYGGDLDVDAFVDVESEAKDLASRMLRFMLDSPSYNRAIMAAGRLVAVSPKVLDGKQAGNAQLPAVVLDFSPASTTGMHTPATATALVMCPDTFEPTVRAAPAAAPVMAAPSGFGGASFGGRGDDEVDEWGALGGGKKKKKKGRRGGGGGGTPRSGPNPYVPGWFGRVSGVHLGLVKFEVSHVVVASSATTRVRARDVLEDGDASAVQAVASFLQDMAGVGMHTWPPVEPPSSDFDLADGYMRLTALRQKAAASKCSGCPRLGDMRKLAQRRRLLRRQIKQLRQRLSNESLSLFPDFQQRLDVLETLGYINGEGAVALKGRVAAQINTADELLLTEMIFESTFGEMEPEEIVALLSALVLQSKVTEEPSLTPRLEAARTAANDIALSLGAVQMKCGLDIIPSEYARSVLKFGLMEVVYEWARGVPFRDICTLTSVQEGIIVRTITRLDETCREVRNAARVVGDSILYRKMEAASAAIKRDIVFASSLYVA